MRRGWLRLWVAISVLVIPAGAIWLASIDMHSWRQQFDWHWKVCDANHQFVHETMDQCLHRFGADEGIYQSEGMTPLTYWSMLLGVSLVADLALTALLVGMFFVARWVVHGFGSADERTSIEEWWGRTFEGRGKITFDNLPDKTDPSAIKKMSTRDVAAHSLGDTGIGGLLAAVELRRRENWTARAAFVVSIVALIVSAARH